MRERDVDGRENKDEVVLGGTNGSFHRKRWFRGGTYLKLRLDDLKRAVRSDEVSLSRER